MDTRTGRIFPPEVLAAYEEESLDEETKAALEDAARADALVSVSEVVAQKVRLGERELARRKRRQKAARSARRRNRD